MGVKCVSAYAFSIENFNRPKEEVDTLMNLFTVKLDEFAKRAKDYKDPLYGSKIRIVGDQSLLSPEMRKKLKRWKKSHRMETISLYLYVFLTLQEMICYILFVIQLKTIWKINHQGLI